MIWRNSKPTNSFYLRKMTASHRQRLPKSMKSTKKIIEKSRRVLSLKHVKKRNGMYIQANPFVD